MTIKWLSHSFTQPSSRWLGQRGGGPTKKDIENLQKSSLMFFHNNPNYSHSHAKQIIVDLDSNIGLTYQRWLSTINIISRYSKPTILGLINFNNLCNATILGKIIPLVRSSTPVSEVSREVANLTERKHLHTPYMLSDNLSFCLFDNYLTCPIRRGYEIYHTNFTST